jgi:Spy/CpxP family protein refolding chaperone
MKRSSRRGSILQHAAALAGGTALGATLLACAGPDWVPPPGSVPDPPPPAVAVAAPPPFVVAPGPVKVASRDEAGDEVLEQHRHHHHGGVTMFIAMALDTLAVSPAERAEVEKIQGVLADGMEAAQEAERKVLATLADGVQGGAVDPAKVDASIAQLAKASGSIHAGTVTSLTKLHDVLTPLERATLADKVQAHWAVWGRVNGGSTHESPIAEMTDLLGLTPDQAEKIRATVTAMPGAAAFDTKDVDAHIRAFESAFSASTFGAKSVALGSADDARLATAGAAYIARFCEAATPLLNADQRTKLAAHLREHLDHSEAPAGT